MDLGLTDRPALVAAASKGIGRACAEALAAEGARVAICSRNEEQLRATAREIEESTGRPVVAIPADVSTAEGAVGFVRDGAEALGGCEILVPNVGGPPPGKFDDFGDEDFQAAFDLLFQSTARMIRGALPHMRSAGYGRIAIIGSSSMREPIPNLILSSSIRAGVSGLAKSLAHELGPEGITVNVIVTGSINTERALLRGGSVEGLPMGRLGEPRELGDLVAYLASERAAYITGTFIPVDGGMLRSLF